MPDPNDIWSEKTEACMVTFARDPRNAGRWIFLPENDMSRILTVFGYFSESTIVGKLRIFTDAVKRFVAEKKPDSVVFDRDCLSTHDAGLLSGFMAGRPDDFKGFDVLVDQGGEFAICRNGDPEQDETPFPAQPRS